MTGLVGTTASPAATMPPAGTPLIRRLMGLNLALVALQGGSAGLILSGWDHAVTMHAAVAVALQLGALLQAISAVVLWRRGSVARRVAGMSVVLFVMLLVQVGLGYSKRYWLHVPIGVGLFGGLIRQLSRLDATSR